MKANTKRRASVALIALPDFGPRQQHVIKHLEVVEDADPDQPQQVIKRARRYDPLRSMDLTDAQRVAAAWYRDQVELAEGVRGGDGGGGGGGLQPWQKNHYPDVVLDAIGARRGAIRAVGMRLSAVFVAVVELHMPLRAVERDLGLRNGTARGLVIDALELLSVYFSTRR